MKKTILISIIGLILAGFCVEAAAQNQEYVATPVSISKDKVRNNGKVYYSHVVLEKQTLFSISKVYGVTLQEIYAANPALNLETEGLKTYQILLIPDHSSTAQAEPETKPQEKNTPAPQQTSPQTKPSDEVYITHTVKWFEDLGAIAKKYGVSPEAIMKMNGMTSSTLKKKQKLRIPVADAEVVEEVSKPEEHKTIVETISEAITEKAEDILGFSKKDVNATVILPFNASKTPNENNLEFYSGILLAARDLEEEGIHTELNVYDAVNGNIPVTTERFNLSDIVIGPLAPSDLVATLEKCPESTAVVSPLDPKAADLVKSYPNLIHAPAPADAQCRELINWLKQEMKSNDKVVLLTEKGATQTSNSASLIKYLSQSGINYATINYGILEGKNISASLEKYASETGTCRVIVASESEAFVNDAIRNTNLLVHKKYQVALYCLSKVRNFDTIEVENFHNTNMHVCISYFVDYDSPKVQKFLMAYRALFNAEPGPFAFHGYDTAYYFIKSCSENGRRWTNKIENTIVRGLQSNFKFEQTEDGGHINNAVRRVLYCPDYSVKAIN